MGAASASHTFKKGKYKCKVSNKEYKKIKKGIEVTKKVGTKKATKWKTKKMKTYETWTDSDGYVYKSKYWNPYKKFGYKAKYVKSVWKYYSDGDICWDYFKVPCKVKKNVYMSMCYSKFKGKIMVDVYTN
jgi:MoaA/NifB/PqqE/SkfB family radical SAM enzyme